MIVDLIGEKHCRIDTGSFQNDMTSLKNKDDVLTLLVHLGYLAYDRENEQCYIPNYEIRQELNSAIKRMKWEPKLKNRIIEIEPRPYELGSISIILFIYNLSQ